jgi:hypothetical protein
MRDPFAAGAFAAATPRLASATALSYWWQCDLIAGDVVNFKCASVDVAQHQIGRPGGVDRGEKVLSK